MMQTLLSEMERSRKRLNYYAWLKEQKTTSPLIDKWITIYSERLRKLESQVQKTGKPAQDRKH